MAMASHTVGVAVLQSYFSTVSDSSACQAIALIAALCHVSDVVCLQSLVKRGHVGFYTVFTPTTAAAWPHSTATHAGAAFMVVCSRAAALVAVCQLKMRCCVGRQRRFTRYAAVQCAPHSHNGHRTSLTRSNQDA